mgnify:CR=1 FL=1
MKLLNAYYRRSGLYTFALRNILKVTGIVLLLLVGLYFLDKYVFDINGAFRNITEKLPAVYVYLVFFTSETLFGLVPPDIFIAWANSFQQPWLILTFLSVLSYLGGVTAYKLGYWFRKIPRINNYLERRFGKYKKQVKKWGGIVIIIAALFPLPFSTICIMAGTMRYPFIKLILFGLTRFLRFFLYALAIFKVI